MRCCRNSSLPVGIEEDFGVCNASLDKQYISNSVEYGNTFTLSSWNTRRGGNWLCVSISALEILRLPCIARNSTGILSKPLSTSLGGLRALSYRTHEFFDSQCRLEYRHRSAAGAVKHSCPPSHAENINDHPLGQYTFCPTLSRVLAKLRG